MKKIIENQARANVELLHYAYRNRKSGFNDPERALRERSIRFLVEASGFDESDIAGKIQATKETIAKIVEALPDGMAMKEKLAELESAIPGAAEISGAIIEDDEKKLKNLAKLVASSTDDAGEFAATVSTAFTTISAQFQKLSGNLSDDEKKKKLSVLGDEAAKDPDAWKNKFITLDQLTSGLKKAFVPPPWYKRAIEKGQEQSNIADGMLGKIAAWITGAAAGAKTPSSNDFVTDVLNISFQSFIDTADAMRPLATTLETAVPGSASAAATTTAAAAGGAPPVAGETTKDSVVSKQEFIDLLKNSPLLLSKEKGAQKQRLTFKKAVNKATGKTVFEEGLLTGRRSPSKKPDSTNEDDTFNRWKELAGIKS